MDDIKNMTANNFPTSPGVQALACARQPVCKLKLALRPLESGQNWEVNFDQPLKTTTIFSSLLLKLLADHQQFFLTF